MSVGTMERKKDEGAELRDGEPNQEEKMKEWSSGGEPGGSDIRRSGTSFIRHCGGTGGEKTSGLKEVINGEEKDV